MGAEHLYSAIHGESVVSRRHRMAQRRIRRIRFRDTWPLRVWLLLIALVIVVLLTPWIADLHQQLHSRRPMR